MNDELTNPEDQITPPSATPNHGRTFTFMGKTLNRFSWHHYCAWLRLFEFGDVSGREAAPVLLYLLQRNAAGVDRLRSEAQLSAFRIEAGDWAERTPEARSPEAFALYQEILADREDAGRVTVKTSGVGDVSGNG